MSTNSKPFYTGAFRHSLDDKNRLTIPSGWRSAHTPDDTFLIVPLDGCLGVLPPAEVEKLYERVAAQSLSDTEAQEAAADFFSKTQNFTFDKAGRVMISDELRAHAGIAKDAVLVGMMSKFAIYEPGRWERVQAAQNAQKASDRLKRMGI